MSKIFDLYTKDKDGNDISRTWYKSSNITYSECVDYDNKPKTLRVVFNNGTQYEYKDVQVSHFLLFRDAMSQGKALNEYIKGNGYEYNKLENADLATLAFTDEECREMLENKENYIGKMATVCYFGETKDGMLRFPITKGIRDYE